MFVKYIIKLFFQFHFFAVVSDIEPQPSCQQHHHYHHHIAVVVIITFVPTIIIYHHYFHYLTCFWVVKQKNNKWGTCAYAVNLNDQLGSFSFPFCVSALNSPQNLRSSHWWLSTSMWWVRLFFECTSYHSTLPCQLLQGNRQINRRSKGSTIW